MFTEDNDTESEDSEEADEEASIVITQHGAERK
jgi:hypothetical protein